MKQKTRKISFRLTPELHKYILRAAADRKKTISHFICDVMTNEFSKTTQNHAQ